MFSSSSSVTPLSRPFLVALLLWVLIWTGMRTLGEANLDPYGDMLETWAWGQTWSWGTHKHPPLMVWIAKAWFTLWPTTTFAYKLLAYVNAAIGLLGILQLTRLYAAGSGFWAVLVAASWGFPNSTLASKFNANAILLAVWPWVAVAWTQVFDHRAGKGWSVLLGLLAAFAMLAKYYSGVLLLGLFLSSLLTPNGRRWYATSAPWLTLVVFIACLLPHMFWLWNHHWVTVTYIGEQGDGHIAWTELWHFTLSPILYWGLAWIGTALLMAPSNVRWHGLGSRLIDCWRPQGRGDVLFWLALAPWLITLAFGLSGFVHLSLPWAIPIGYAYPVLWVRNLLARGADSPALLVRRSRRLHVIGLVLLALIGPVYAWSNAKSGSKNYFLPRAEAAQALIATWHQRYPDVPLRWVGGMWQENGLLGFYGDSALSTLPGTPDSPGASVNEHSTWATEGGSLLCPAGWQDETQLDLYASTLLADRLDTDCARQARDWLRTHGRSAPAIIAAVHRSGFAFPNAPVFVYVAYVYLP